MEKTLTSTTFAAWASFIAAERSTTAPNPAVQGTAVSCAGMSAYAAAAHPAAAHPAAAHSAQVAVFGARVIDLPGLVPRGAPV